jgi:flotillin
MDVFIIQRLETILDQIAEKTNEVSVDEAALIDGGDGESLPNYVSAYPKIMGNILREMRDTMGIDVSGALRGDPSEHSTAAIGKSPGSDDSQSETVTEPAE